MPPRVFFRGDSREPPEIKRDGFALHNEAAAEVQRAGGILKYLITTLRGVNGFDVQRWIVTGRQRHRPTISTALDQDCGGYGGSYIYQIEFANLYETALLPGTPAFTKLCLIDHRGAPRLRLVMDNMLLERARMIAIGLCVGTNEVSFLTDIASGNITQYRHRTSPNFTPMSTVQPAGSKFGRMDLSRYAAFQK